MMHSSYGLSPAIVVLNLFFGMFHVIAAAGNLNSTQKNHPLAANVAKNKGSKTILFDECMTHHQTIGTSWTSTES